MKRIPTITNSLFFLSLKTKYYTYEMKFSVVDIKELPYCLFLVENIKKRLENRKKSQKKRHFFNSLLSYNLTYECSSCTLKVISCYVYAM